MTNILFTIIVALSMKVADLTLSPKYYLITYEDGQREEVVITNSEHICPHYCKVEHAHKVNMCEGGECINIDKDFTIRKEQNIMNNSFNLYCKGKEIMLFQEIKRKADPKKGGNSIKLF